MQRKINNIGKITVRPSGIKNTCYAVLVFMVTFIFFIGGETAFKNDRTAVEIAFEIIFIISVVAAGLAIGIYQLRVAIGHGIHNRSISVTPTTLTCRFLGEMGKRGKWHTVTLPGTQYTVALHLLSGFQLCKTDKGLLALSKFREGAIIPEYLPITYINGQPGVAMDLQSFKRPEWLINTINTRLQSCSSIPASVPQRTSVFPPVSVDPSSPIRFKTRFAKDSILSIIFFILAVYTVMFGLANLPLFIIILGVAALMIISIGFAISAFGRLKRSKIVSIAYGTLTAPIEIADELPADKNVLLIKGKKMTVALKDISPFEVLTADNTNYIAVSRSKLLTANGYPYYIISGEYFSNLARFLQVANALIYAASVSHQPPAVHCVQN